MIRTVLRYIYRTLLPLNLRQSADIFKHLRLGEVEGLKEKKVLVISPHPDDDIIGCGGTLNRYSQKNTEITSVYMTDGCRGSMDTDCNEKELVTTRRLEAEKAAAIIGITNIIFLDNKDTELHLSASATAEITRILADIRPEAVFLPFFLDNHSDHMAANRIFLAAMESFPPVMCYTWGIWTLLPTFNCSVDITACIDIKKKALEAHESQIKESDLVGATLGVNKYYSVMTGGNGWAEVFIACTSREYKRLTEAAGW